MKKISQCALLFCTITVLSFLQSSSAYSQSRHILRHYTNNNGLPAHGVKGMEIDRQTGFVWIGTQAGLVRFDGTNFIIVDAGKEISPSSRVLFISKNDNGTIYCEDDNLSIYRVKNNMVKLVARDTMLFIGGNDRELEITEYVAMGMSTKEIALKMRPGNTTISTYLRRAFEKLNVQT